VRRGLPDPLDVSCATFEVAEHELLMIEFSLPQLEIPPGLSHAETAVVRELLEGRSPREIARLRAASVHTVRNQIRSVHKKLGVSNISELARVCFGPGKGPDACET
jgi:DNA-binding CsgD family transcriptional regulator